MCMGTMDIHWSCVVHKNCLDQIDYKVFPLTYRDPNHIKQECLHEIHVGNPVAIMNYRLIGSNTAREPIRNLVIHLST